MAFGTGSAVAHRAVDAVMGPRVIQHETVDSSSSSAPAVASNPGGSEACNVQSKAFQDVGSLFSIVIYDEFLLFDAWILKSLTLLSYFHTQATCIFFYLFFFCSA